MEGVIVPAASWRGRIGLALSDIKIAHSVFALPFAVLAAVIAMSFVGAGLTAEERARAGLVKLWPALVLIVVCMFFARTWAMLVNRLADWRFDRENARTARRVVAAGRLSPRDGWMVAIGCAGCFVACCGMFWVFFGNAWPLLLSAPVLGWIALYSYTKRITWLCHVFLGGALAVSPIAAAIAIAPEWVFSGDARVVFWLAGFVLLWVAGFDVAYALQDLEFDRATGLQSIPARLGSAGALWVARGLHLGAFVCLVMAWRSGAGFGSILMTGVGVVGGILVFEHVVLARRGVAGLPLAFFTLNGMVSVLLGALGIVDSVI